MNATIGVSGSATRSQNRVVCTPTPKPHHKTRLTDGKLMGRRTRVQSGNKVPTGGEKTTGVQRNFAERLPGFKPASHSEQQRRGRATRVREDKTFLEDEKRQTPLSHNAWFPRTKRSRAGKDPLATTERYGSPGGQNKKVPTSALSQGARTKKGGSGALAYPSRMIGVETPTGSTPNGPERSAGRVHVMLVPLL